MKFISTVILSQFDDKNLADCVMHTRKFSDEVIIVSIGGRPNIENVKIVELGPDRLVAYGFAWCRNEGRKVACGNWIVYVDTDEAFAMSLHDLHAEIDAAEARGKIAIRTKRWASQVEGDSFHDVLSAGLWAEESLQWRIHKNDSGISWFNIVHEEPRCFSSHVADFSHESGIALLHLKLRNYLHSKSKGVLHELIHRAQTIPSIREHINHYWLSLPSEQLHVEFWENRGVKQVTPSESPYATHQRTLRELLEKLDNPHVIELGCGPNSTSFLRSLAGKFESYETDVSYATACGSTWVPSYNAVEPVECDVLFIDQHPVDRRNIDIARFANKARFIVAHDTEAAAYHYARTLPCFLHKYTDVRERPWTSVVSNFEPIPLVNGLHDYILVEPA